MSGRGRSRETARRERASELREMRGGPRCRHNLGSPLELQLELAGACVCSSLPTIPSRSSTAFYKRPPILDWAPLAAKPKCVSRNSRQSHARLDSDSARCSLPRRRDILHPRACLLVDRAPCRPPSLVSLDGQEGRDLYIEREGRAGGHDPKVRNLFDGTHGQPDERRPPRPRPRSPFPLALLLHTSTRRHHRLLDPCYIHAATRHQSSTWLQPTLRRLYVPSKESAAARAPVHRHIDRCCGIPDE
ncbi:hypothetical protein FA95DRAFT_1401060 [Auriscalpium vulgare]|uniref:Uncharacterized protein n=1 Tax=Auriscalpium vulgare TaxID=40419 RepID=A0ACB8RQS0_9AGAM|nr:hypothetical protein FA95DRAFT_1401060 [Auriscalpium vulgare]